MYSIALIHEGDPYPSWRALAPCVGTMLILLFGETRGVANRILCWPPFVLIGLAAALPTVVAGQEATKKPWKNATELSVVSANGNTRSQTASRSP